MNSIIRPIFVVGAGVLALLAAPTTPAQEVSNIGAPSSNSIPLAADSWVAQLFFTGNTGASLTVNAVQLQVNAALGSPSGFSVSIYGNSGSPNFWTSGDVPKGSLGTLTGHNPLAGGLFIFTTPGITLAPSSAYYLVLTAATPSSQGTYQWSQASSQGTAADGWSIQDIYETSANGSTWTDVVRQPLYQFAIYTTPTPEPNTYALAAVALAGFVLRRFRPGK